MRHIAQLTRHISSKTPDVVIPMVFNPTITRTLDNPNLYGTSMNDRFGHSLSISDNYTIIGAYQEDDVNGGNSGKAYIFNVATGALVHTLDNPNVYGTSTSDEFGRSVSISGNYAIVGAPAEDDEPAFIDPMALNQDGAGSGKAYIYNVTTGALVHILDNPNAYDTSMADFFGYSVAISGNYAIVGVYNEDDASGSTSGKAYIFNVTTGALVHTLHNPNVYGTSTNDWFGHSVAISGNYAIVGAHYEDFNATYADSGKAYIFNVTTGALIHTIDNPNAYGEPSFDQFGWSVAISGNHAIVGAAVESDADGISSGKAYIFDVTTGALIHTMNNPNAYDVSTGDYFGWSVAISSNYAIVCAMQEDDVGGISSGKVYIFDITTGALVHTLDNPTAYDTSYGDYFGYSLAISGNNAIVGAYGEDDVNGSTSGKAYIYSLMQ